MKKRKCYLFVFDGFADWEPALAIAALQRYTDFQVLTFSATGKPVRSMGNVHVLPDTSMDHVNVEDVNLLLLPGGEHWDEAGNLEIVPLLNSILDAGKAVAAICGATGFLAQHGYLDNVRHTSNDLEYYLKKVAPDYKGEKNYVHQPCVREGNLITATGTAPLAFAEEVLNHFGLFSVPDVKTWFGYFKGPQAIH
jgi:putative intracellular protease/amidase